MNIKDFNAIRRRATRIQMDSGWAVPSGAALTLAYDEHYDNNVDTESEWYNNAHMLMVVVDMMEVACESAFEWSKLHDIAFEAYCDGEFDANFLIDVSLERDW